MTVCLADTTFSLFQKKYFIDTIERKTFQDHAFFAHTKILLLVQSYRSVGFTVLCSAPVLARGYTHIRYAQTDFSFISLLPLGIVL